MSIPLSAQISMSIDATRHLVIDLIGDVPGVSVVELVDKVRALPQGRESIPVAQGQAFGTTPALDF